MATQGQEFRYDLAVLRPGKAFFGGEAATVGGVGEHLLAVGGRDETDEHLLEREGGDGLECEVHLAGDVFALDGESAVEEEVAGKHRGFLRLGPSEGAGERRGHFLRDCVARGVMAAEGSAGAGRSSESAGGLGAGGAPLSSSQARIWNG